MRRLACAAAALIGAPAAAETIEDARGWLNLTAIGSARGRLLYFAEAQGRTQDGLARGDQLLLRPALGVKLSERVSLYQGYAYVLTRADGGPDPKEHRSFQQLSWSLGQVGRGQLSSRTRLEQRWRSDGDEVGWRVRNMIRYQHPIREDGSGPQLLGWTEPFVALNDTDWGARSGFDQIRTFAGLVVPLPGKSTVEVGYLNQLVDLPAGRRRVNHVASVTLWVRP